MDEKKYKDFVNLKLPLSEYMKYSKPSAFSLKNISGLERQKWLNDVNVKTDLSKLIKEN